MTYDFFDSYSHLNHKIVNDAFDPLSTKQDLKSLSILSRICLVHVLHVDFVSATSVNAFENEESKEKQKGKKSLTLFDDFKSEDFLTKFLYAYVHHVFL